MLECKLLSEQEFREADDARLALAKQRGEDPAWLTTNKYGWARMDEVIAVGSMWYCRWYYDPHGTDKEIKRIAMRRMAEGKSPGYLSRYYWQDWSDKRPPLCVLCPNGREWMIDAKSNNGDGWVVTGEAPALVVHPSIDVPGYHGWLGSNGHPPGWFSNDLNGRGPQGRR
jgi:hypothetical protein